MFDGLFIFQRVSTSISLRMQEYFIKIILVCEIIKIDKF